MDILSRLAAPSANSYRLHQYKDKDEDPPKVSYNGTTYYVGYRRSNAGGAIRALSGQKEFHVVEAIPIDKLFAGMLGTKHLYKTGVFASIKNQFIAAWKRWVLTGAIQRDYGNYDTLERREDPNGHAYPSKISCAGQQYTVEMHTEYHIDGKRLRRFFTVGSETQDKENRGTLAGLKSKYRQWNLERMVNEGYGRMETHARGYNLSEGTELQEPGQQRQPQQKEST